MEEFTGMEKDKFEEGTWIVLNYLTLVTAFRIFFKCTFDGTKYLLKYIFISIFTTVAVEAYYQSLNN